MVSIAESSLKLSLNLFTFCVVSLLLYCVQNGGCA